MAGTPQPASTRDDGPNPYDRFIAEDPDHGSVSLAERARLNMVDAAYRGTVSGAADLADFKRAMPDQYERIATDLARYETLRAFEGPLESTVALAGQLFGGMQSPEAFLSPGARAVAGLTERLVGGVASRILGGAAGQAAVQAVANPAIQASEIQSALRKDFSPREALAAAGTGALLGGALHGAGEAAGALARGAKGTKIDTDALARAHVAEQQAVEARNMAALASEDPALRPDGEKPASIAGGRPTEETGSAASPRSETGTAEEIGANPGSADSSLPPDSKPEGIAPPEAPAMDAPAVVADPAAAAARAAADVPASPPEETTQFGLIASGLDEADRVKKRWRSETPYDDADAMLAAAPANQRALGEAGRDIAAELGVEFKDPGVKAIGQGAIDALPDAADRAKRQKGLDRFMDKVGGRKPGHVTDLVRGGFLVTDPAQGDSIVGRLAQRFPVIDEGWVRTQAGYFDRKVYVRFPDGMLGELQMWEPSLLERKSNGGNGLYEEMRKLSPGDPQKAVLERQMIEHYRPAYEGLSPDWRAAVEGNGGSASPNLALNRSGESAAAFMRTSEEFASTHRSEPSGSTQAFPGDQSVGSPSSEPSLNSSDISGASRGNITSAAVHDKAGGGVPPLRAATKAHWTDLREATASDAPPWAPKIQAAFDELARGFGFEAPRLSVGKPRYAEEGPLYGANDRHGNIVLNETMGEHHALNNAIHEFGHEVQFRLYESAPEETRAAIREAFRAATKRDYGKTSLNQLRPVTATRKLGEAGQPKRIKIPRTGDEPIPPGSAADYQHSFVEWFAEQVSRWVTTDARSVGVVERFFSGVAEAWRKIYERIAGHTPLAPEMRAFLEGHWEGGRRPAPDSGDRRADTESSTAPPTETIADATPSPNGQRAPQDTKGDLRFRNREPAAAGSEPGRPAPPEGTAPPDGVPESPAAEPLRSLQQQAQDLADALDVPLRQGRVQGGRRALAQYDVGQDVVRIRNTADLESVAHEVAHAIENKIGTPLSDLIDRHTVELGPLDYDPQRGDPGEGFAEWMRHLIGNPAEGQRLAPTFATAFRDLLAREAPETLTTLDHAIVAQQAWKAADPVAQLGAIVRKPDEDTVLQAIKRDGMASTVGLYMHKAYTLLQDRQAPAARAVRQIAGLMREATGERVRLDGAANPENGLRAFRATQQAAISDLKYGVVPYRGVRPEGPSLADALAVATGKPKLLGTWDKAGVAQLNQYLVAKRAEVLFRRMADDPDLRRPLAMTHDQVRVALAQMEVANPRLRQAADLVHQFTRQLLRKQYEGGLIDADLYARLMADEFYVPLYRHMDERPSPSTGAGGSDGPGTVQTVRRLRGSDRDIIPPTDALMTQAILVNRTLQHNDIIKAFVGLARQARAVGATGVGRILEEIPATQLMGQRFDVSEMVRSAARQSGMHADDIAVLNGALADVFGDDPILATVFRAGQAAKRGEPILFWKEGGQQRAVRLQSDAEGLALYESLAALPTAQRDVALRALSLGTAALRAGVTKSLGFALANFIRDQLAVTILRPGFKPLWDGVSGAISALRNDEWAQMYAYAGGISPGLGASGLRELVDRAIDALARQGWVVQKIAELAELRHGNLLAPLKAIGETAELAEQGTRLAVFKSVYRQKKRQGLSDYDAMFEAAAQSRDLLDFDRHRAGLDQFRLLVAFLNPHLQGLDKARRTLIEPILRAGNGSDHLASDVEKLKNAGLSWGLLGVSAGLGAAYGAMNANNLAYRNASEELRATHLIIPGATFGLPNFVIVWPKPFELAMGFNLGELAGLHMATGDPRAAEFALAGIREVLQPPDPLTGIPLLKTGAELALNRSFFTRRDIVPEHLQNRENPRFEYTDRTSSAARAIGDALNISPIKVDYAVGSMFGSWGRDLLAASSRTDPNAPAAALDRTMILQRFVKDAHRNETDKLYWEQAGQRNGAFAQAAARYGDLLKGFHDREAADYLAALPAAQRAYVMLSQGGDEETGKAAFNADDRRLHPITRGAAAVQTVSGLIRELSNNSQKAFADGTRIAMDPQKRRDVIDALRVMQAIEQHNAMVMTRQRGYENQPLLSAEDQFAVLKAHSPVAAAELATRYATNRILPTETVAKLWPEAQRRLLADGTQAEIRDLALDAKADGWAFGGEAVRKPQRRRVPITPGAPPPASAPRILPGLSVPKDNPVPNPFN